MGRPSIARIILIRNCSELSYSTRLSSGISLWSAKYFLSYTLLNNIYIFPPCRGTHVFVYIGFSFPELSPRLIVRLRMAAFRYTYFLTYFLPTDGLIFPISLFWSMDNTWHARGTGPCPSDPKLQNGRDNKLILPKITKMPFIQGGLKGSFSLLLICRGYPRGRVVVRSGRKVEWVKEVSLSIQG